ncbi:hypothetical protein tb265_15820 [Gemmatimonadetes bacterium T265]|nr:hypothetical protein tb265_15820 [Gemmatimonadetes bacterium T265]
MAARLGPAFVGAVFVYAGAVKALAPLNFQAHLSRLGWIPARLLAATVVAVAAVETGLGVALLVGLTPGPTLPVTAVGVLLLGAASFWSVRSGRVTDCGCYGGYFTPSVAQSVGLNALYATLLLLAWTAGAREPGSFWKVCLVVGLAVVTGVLTGVAQHHESANGRPLIDLNPLKPGRRWRAAWAAGAVSSEPQERLVAYLGTDCPFCHQWVRVLNVVHGSPELPDVVGVVGAPAEARQGFVAEHGIRFPVVSLRRSRLDRLVSAVPTTVLIEHGVITSKWVGNIAPEFLTRFNRAFFPNVQHDAREDARAALETSAER